MLVPGLAFDRHGGRLGFGKGYYDRLLLAAGDAVKIGLGYSFQILKTLPADAHDVKMDLIMTEKESIGAEREE